MSRTRGILPLPSSLPALRAELQRLTRELGRLRPGPARRVLATERRRTLIALDDAETREQAAAVSAALLERLREQVGSG